MDVRALISWILTALGGFILLGQYISRGGVQQQREGTTRFPPALIFGHFALAAIGLVVWIIYMATDSTAIAWIAVIMLAIVAAMGLAMFARWMGRRRQAAPAGAAATGGTTGAATAGTTAAVAPAENSFPPVVVYLHGLLAILTLVFAVIAAASD